MSQEDFYEEQQPASGTGKSGSANLPTILASAGVAAIVSALILTIGVVGLATSDRFNNSQANQATPTVVNLGSAQNGALQSGGQNGGVQNVPAQDGTLPAAPAGAPVGEQVPESGGGAGSGTQGQTAPAAPQAPGQQAPQGGGSTQAATPKPLTAGQLNTKIRLIMNTGAPRATRADELQGGMQAMSNIDQVAQMLQVSGAGFTYKMVDPVRASGDKLTARLQMSLVGNGSRYRDLTWIWMGTKWRLSNASVCVIAEYALQKCAV